MGAMKLTNRELLQNPFCEVLGSRNEADAGRISLTVLAMPTNARINIDIEQDENSTHDLASLNDT